MDPPFGWLVVIWGGVNWNAVGSIIAALALVSAVRASGRATRQQRDAAIVQTKHLMILIHRARGALAATEFGFRKGATSLRYAQLATLAETLDRIDESRLPNDEVLEACLDARQTLHGFKDVDATAEVLLNAGLDYSWVQESNVRELEELWSNLRDQCLALGGRLTDADGSLRPEYNPDISPWALEGLAKSAPVPIELLKEPISSGLAGSAIVDHNIALYAVDLLAVILSDVSFDQRDALGIKDDIRTVASILTRWDRWRAAAEDGDLFPEERRAELEDALHRIQAAFSDHAKRRRAAPFRKRTGGPWALAKRSMSVQ